MRKFGGFILLTAGCFSFAAPTPKVVEWKVDAPNCSVIYVNGKGLERIIDNGRVVDAFAPTTRDKHIFQVLAGVTNHSTAAVDLDPARTSALSDDKEPVFIPAIDADAKLAKEENHQRHMLAIATGMSAMGGDSNGATRDGVEAQGRLHAAYLAEAGKILRRTTVAPGDDAGGAVYMQKVKGMGKTSQIEAFRIDMGDVVYIFHFTKGAIPNAKP